MNIVNAPADGIRVEPLLRTDAVAWADYVVRSTDSTLCHLPGWASVIERVWGHTPHHLVARRGAQVAGILPLFRVKALGFGSSLVSSPNAVYGGAAADDAEARAALIAGAKKLARDLRVDYLELRDSLSVEGDDLDPELHRKDLYVTFDCPITTDEEALGKQFQRDIRRLVRVAGKNGLTASVGRESRLDAFYEVYASSVHHLGTPVFPKRLFAEFLREFPDESDILLVTQGDRVAGGVLSFYFRDTVLPYYGGAYGEFYRTGVNNFMYWELMKHAAARGCRRFDFGRSKKGTGAYAFKHGWDMRETPLPYHFYLVKATQLPDVNPANAKYRLMVDLWKKLPLPVTKIVGPRLVKYFP